MQEQSTARRARSSKGTTQIQWSKTRFNSAGKPYGRKAITLDGKRVYAFGYTKQEIEKAEQKLRADHALGKKTYGIKKYRVAEFAEIWFADQGRTEKPEGWSPATVNLKRRYLDLLLPLLGRYTLLELQDDPDTIERGMAGVLAFSRSRRRSTRMTCVRTRNDVRATLSQIFNYAIRLRKQTGIYENPLGHVSKLDYDPSARRLQPSVGLAQFRETLRTSPLPHERALYVLIRVQDACGGIRSGELLALRWDDFRTSPDGGPIPWGPELRLDQVTDPVVVIQRHLGEHAELIEGRKGKPLGHKESILINHLDPEILPILNEWRKTVIAGRLKKGKKWYGPDPRALSSQVFYSVRGNPIKVERYADIFANARDKYGLPRHETPHMIRHHYATEAQANGAPITAIAAILGDRADIVARTYAAETDASKRAAVAARAAVRAAADAQVQRGAARAAS